MVVIALRGSEHRRPIFNLLLSLLLLFMYCPSVVVAALRPKNLVKRMLTGLPVASTTTITAETDERLETNEDTIMTEKNGIGGGAINEKKRQYNQDGTTQEQAPNDDDDEKPVSMSSYAPTKHTAHLYHALEGLDRYPRYLARWQEGDIDQLEAALEEKLALVRQQKQQVVQERQEAANQLVQTLLTEHEEKDRWKRLLQPCTSWDDLRQRILHPTAVQAIFQSKMFHPKRNTKAETDIPSVQAVQNGQVKVELDPERLESWLDEELYDVYSFRLLNDDFCHELVDFSRAFTQVSDARDDLQKHQLSSRPQNLDLLGLSWVNDLLFHLVMRPVARELFLQSEGLASDLDWRHGYIAGYSAKPGSGRPRERLVTHTDDSEVTMNICLGDEFEGGLLEFRGLRGTPEEGQLVGTFEPQRGLGLIHAGRHFHDVTQVSAGDRFAFIIWARSWSGIRSTKCPCCWLNRRQETDCICGPRWN